MAEHDRYEDQNQLCPEEIQILLVHEFEEQLKHIISGLDTLTLEPMESLEEEEEEVSYLSLTYNCHTDHVIR